MREGDGYLKQQSTCPQSLGFGLGDSPIGLLAWLVDNFHDWMDVANYEMSDDEVITFVMMHWMQAATPGLGYYKAASQESGPTNMKNAFTTYHSTPMGMSKFPKEVAILPMDWMRAFANVQFFKEHDTGGHFPAVECPDALIGNLREWFWSNIVKEAIGARGRGVCLNYIIGHTHFDGAIIIETTNSHHRSFIFQHLHSEQVLLRNPLPRKKDGSPRRPSSANMRALKSSLEMFWWPWSTEHVMLNRRGK